MSMSTHIIGFAPPDETWEKMKAVWDTCEAAEIPIPDSVEEFFDWAKPDPAGVNVNLDLYLRPWSDKSGKGFEVDLNRIPSHVRMIRFYNSW